MLEARLALIDELRKGQNAPVHMIDQISRALPEMTWLTSVQQEGYDAHDPGPVPDADVAVGLRRQPRRRRATSTGPSRSSRARWCRRRQDAPDLIQFTIRGTFQMAGIDSVAPPPPTNVARREASVASLSALHWQAPVDGAARRLRGALARASAGAFYYFYEMPAQAAMATRSTELDRDSRRASTRGRPTARQLPEFRKQVGELEARLEVLKPILPDERDAGDLLRRVQTLAVQSNLTIRGFRPQAITPSRDARRVADQPAARRQLSQPRPVPRSREQVPAHHQHRQHRAWPRTHRRRPPLEHAHRRARRRRSFSIGAAAGSTERRRTAGEEMMNTPNCHAFSVVALVAAVGDVAARSRAQAPAAGSAAAGRRPRRRPRAEGDLPSPPANFEYTRGRAGAIRSSAWSTAAPTRARRPVSR